LVAAFSVAALSFVAFSFVAFSFVAANKSEADEDLQTGEHFDLIVSINWS
jgi:hypothetical protein